MPPELLDEEDFKIMYSPPNTTSLTQPMDKGIIAKLIALYRHKTIRKTATYQDEINEFQKQFTLKDCIQVLHDSWMEVSADNVINFWKKIIPKQTDTYRYAKRQNLSNLTRKRILDNLCPVVKKKKKIRINEDNVYKIYDTGLLSKALPSKTFAESKER